MGRPVRRPTRFPISLETRACQGRLPKEAAHNGGLTFTFRYCYLLVSNNGR